MKIYRNIDRYFYKMNSIKESHIETDEGKYFMHEVDFLYHKLDSFIIDDGEIA